MNDHQPSEESDPASFHARANDVRALARQGDIDLAVRRLLDLARDFAPTRRELRNESIELSNESIALSAKHDHLTIDERRHGVSSEGSRERDRLTTRILELTEAIADAQPKPPRPVVGTPVVLCDSLTKTFFGGPVFSLRGISLTATDFLRTVARLNLQVRYFRDISTSTQAMLREP
jgi:hypothetical protein